MRQTTIMFIKTRSTTVSAGNIAPNNLFSGCCDEQPFNISTDGSTIAQDYNLAFDSGWVRPPFQTGSHNVTGLDPLFTNASALKMWPHSNSPAVNAGGPLTTTIGIGSGPTLTLADA